MKKLGTMLLLSMALISGVFANEALVCDMSYDDIIPIASDFRKFVRAMGTAQYAVWKNAEKEFVELMSKELTGRSLEFWKELVQEFS